MKKLLILFLFSTAYAMPTITYVHSTHEELRFYHESEGWIFVDGMYNYGVETIFINETMDEELQEETLQHEVCHYIDDVILTPRQRKLYTWIHRKNPYYPTDYSRLSIQENFAEVCSQVIREDYPNNFQTRMIERIIINNL